MKEKILIIFIALIIGLLITTGAFYIYHTTTKTSDSKNPIAVSPSQPIVQEKAKKLSFEITEPKDETLVDRRSIEVKGKTDPTHTIIVTTPSEDVIYTPESDGKFSVNVTIDTGVNTILIRSIDSSGEETVQEKTVTYNTEDF